MSLVLTTSAATPTPIIPPLRGVITAHITCLIDLIVLSVQRLNETSLNGWVVRDFRLRANLDVHVNLDVDTKRSLPREHCNNLKLWLFLIQDSVSLDHISTAALLFRLPVTLPSVSL